MQLFFKDIESLDRFTLSLDLHQDSLACDYCSSSDQFVSHGFVYKQRSQTLSEAVGKRIFCSNRNGRSGCGRTVRLYIASESPSLQYSTVHLFTFLCALLANLTVKAAYQKVTRWSKPRNAWRWLNKLDRRLMEYRCFLQTRSDVISTSFESRPRRLQILLPTIAQLFSKLEAPPCAHYQRLSQLRFI